VPRSGHEDSSLSYENHCRGRINTLVRRTEADGRVHTYQIKGNVMTALTVQGNKASFTGKASNQDITHPDQVIPVDGNAALRVHMTDNGETGSSDQLAITIFNKSGGVWFASAWDGVRPHEQTLAGGNIRVNSGGIIRKNGRMAFPEPSRLRSLSLYPNPAGSKLTVALGDQPASAVQASRVTDPAGVTHLLNAHQPAGQHTVELDVSALRPGLYMLHLLTQTSSVVLKFTKH
jgi:hypothetical protein